MQPTDQIYTATIRVERMGLWPPKYTLTLEGKTVDGIESHPTLTISDQELPAIMNIIDAYMERPIQFVRQIVSTGHDTRLQHLMALHDLAETIESLNRAEEEAKRYAAHKAALEAQIKRLEQQLDATT